MHTKHVPFHPLSQTQLRTFKYFIKIWYLVICWLRYQLSMILPLMQFFKAAVHRYNYQVKSFEFISNSWQNFHHEEKKLMTFSGRLGTFYHTSTAINESIVCANFENQQWKNQKAQRNRRNVSFLSDSLLPNSKDSSSETQHFTDDILYTSSSSQ